MTDEPTNHRENGRRKLGNPAEASEHRQARDREADSNAGRDPTRHDALREASRLNTSGAYLVDQDMEDYAERQSGDGPDGRPSPLANADNAQR